MSLTVKHLNSDASFLLAFQPTLSSLPTSSDPPATFTVLLDPWLSGPSKIFHSKFSISHQTSKPCISNLSELPEPDFVIITQDKSDHCHKETLTQLPANGTKTIILAEQTAAKIIRGWKHFDPEKVVTLSKWEDSRSKATLKSRNLSVSRTLENDSIYRISLEALAAGGLKGEVTIALIAQKSDITRLHNALAITYKPPTSLYPFDSHPMTPPATPQSFRSSFTHTGGTRTLSVIYSPHGCNYRTLHPYITSHLISKAAVPLTALLHCFDKVNNAWYLGGNICTGFPGGLELVKNLQPKVWISAHDGDKETKGLATKKIEIKKYAKEEVESVVSPRSAGFSNSKNLTEVMVLKPGEQIHLSHIMDFQPSHCTSSRGSTGSVNMRPISENAICG